MLSCSLPHWGFPGKSVAKEEGDKKRGLAMARSALRRLMVAVLAAPIGAGTDGAMGLYDDFTSSRWSPASSKI